MGKSSAPPAPDYAAAAQQTAAGNANQALIAQYGSMTNQVTPYGSVTYTPNQVGTSPSGDPLNQWTQTVNMTPAEQAMFDQNQAINQQLGNVAQSGVGYVQNAMNNPLQGQTLASTPQSTTNQMVTGIQMPNLQNQVANAGDITRSFANNANQLQTSVQDPNLLAQNTTDALYKANTQYLDPQFEQSQSNLENRLANQGITQGSEAYNRAMLTQSNAKQQAYDSARNNAISGGINAAQGLFGMNLQGGQFANQALGQQFGQNQTMQQAQNSAQAQQFQQNMSQADFASQAAQGMFGASMQNAGLQNQSAQQAYQQALQSGQFQNQTAQQALAQAQALQQNPINMLNAVRTGQQMQVAQMPQVGVSSPAGLNQVAGPDLLGAATATGQYNQNATNAANAASSNMWGSLIGAGGALGGAAIMKSDRRLKKNIVKLGIHKTLGIGLYAWDYLWGEKGCGVMAQELEHVMPEAVITMPDGFKAVNYSMLGA